jgi:PRTRC genetic system protein A
MMRINPAQYEIYRGQQIRLGAGCAFGYYFAGNGTFKFAENAHLRVLMPLAQFRVAGLPNLTPFCALKGERLPVAVLHAIFQDARAQAQARPIEVMYHVKAQDGRVVVDCPEQDGGASSLRYKGGDDPAILLDVHSHCEMHAFFSNTDNRDEQGFRLYGVLGNVFTRPTALFRVGMYGDFWPLHKEQIFQ